MRFSLTAASARTAETEFATLRDHLQVTDSVLSKQVTVVETAGWVRVRKGSVGKRPRTWPKLTEEGGPSVARTPLRSAGDRLPGSAGRSLKRSASRRYRLPCSGAPRRRGVPHAGVRTMGHHRIWQSKHGGRIVMELPR
ncbi:transcriptional regulator [Arthrobacter pityocampae]|uniref:transcriptional regulator n=1 Tax=Arthrobacter pityocampae TaxID=547334 RepID=UPI001F4E0DC2|nr:transcriptional regulator [Arthrobacter pityocampae]